MVLCQGTIYKFLRASVSPWQVFGCGLAVLWTMAAAAQLAPVPQQTQGVQKSLPPSISLSPAVVMARGSFGQGLAQTLTLSNQTDSDFAFDLVAEDVVVEKGQRLFVAAGETEHGIAATAVFSQNTVVVKAHTAASVEVRLTIPPVTTTRAIVALFRGTNRLPTSSTAVGVTASLGALLTFNLTDNIKLQPEPVRVKTASETTNLTVSQWIANTGTEPVVPEGTAVVLNAAGSLVEKTTFPSLRLLPGERLEFAAEFPEQLPAGDYKVLCSFQFEGHTMTHDAAFKIP
jgi:hypothetical protein